MAPDINELKSSVDDLSGRLKSAQDRYLQLLENKIASLKMRSPIKINERRITENGQRLEVLVKLLNSVEYSVLDTGERELKSKAGMLDSLSPLKVFSRGYSIAFLKGKVVTDIGDVAIGDEITTKLIGGEISSTVTDKREKKP